MVCIKKTKIFLFVIVFLAVSNQVQANPTPILITELPDINSTNIVYTDLNITYKMSDNFSDINQSTVLLFFNTTFQGNVTNAFVNGTLIQPGAGISGHYPNTNDTTNHTFKLGDELIYPSKENIIDDPAQSCTGSCHKGADYGTVIQPTNKNNVFKSRFYNITALKSYNRFEAMVNVTTTVGQSPLNVFFCNQSYTSGDIYSSPNCGIIGTYSPSVMFDDISYQGAEGTLADQNMPFGADIVNGTIAGVKITTDNFFALQPLSMGWNIWYSNNITRPDQTRYSSNKGVTWSNFSGTLREHVHQFGNDSFNFYACYNSLSNGTQYCSSVSSDIISLADVAPIGAVFINPDGNHTFINTTNFTITWIAGYSLTNHTIVGYNLSIWQSGIMLKDIGHFNNTTLSYSWNPSEVPIGNDYNFIITTYCNFNLLTNTSSVLFNITQPTYSVSGFILNSTGGGLANATVSYSGRSNISSINGEWMIPDVVNGTYRFTATLSGYMDGEKTITINGTPLTDQNITLLPIDYWLNTRNSISWGVTTLAFIVTNAKVFVETAFYIGIIFVIVFLIGAVFKLGSLIFR